MFDLIILGIFFISFLGIIFIVYRKIPVLTQYVPEQTIAPGFISNIKEKLKNKVAFKAVDSGETILLKTLSKSRVVVLKAEHQIGQWLSVLRQKSIEKEKGFKENYWEKIKAVKKRGRKPKEKNIKPENDNMPM